MSVTNGYGAPYYTIVTLTHSGSMLIRGHRDDLVKQVQHAANTGRPILEWIALGAGNNDVPVGLPWRGIALIGEEQQMDANETKRPGAGT